MLGICLNVVTCITITPWWFLHCVQGDNFCYLNNFELSKVNNEHFKIIFSKDLFLPILLKANILILLLSLIILKFNFKFKQTNFEQKNFIIYFLLILTLIGQYLKYVQGIDNYLIFFLNNLIYVSTICSFYNLLIQKRIFNFIQFLIIMFISIYLTLESLASMRIIISIIFCNILYTFVKKDFKLVYFFLSFVLILGIKSLTNDLRKITETDLSVNYDRLSDSSHLINNEQFKKLQDHNYYNLIYANQETSLLKLDDENKLRYVNAYLVNFVKRIELLYISNFIEIKNNKENEIDLSSYKPLLTKFIPRLFYKNKPI